MTAVMSRRTRGCYTPDMRPPSLALFVLAAAAAAAPAATLEPPKLTFGGQVRARYESASPQGYASAGVKRQQDLYLLRTRLNISVEMPDQKLKAFLQPQDSRTAGAEASVTSNEKNLDMHQAYFDVLDLFGRPLDLRAGRFEMNYGDGRVVTALDWNNVSRSWNGARLRWRFADAWADAFVTKIKDATSTRASSHFWGLYASSRRLAGHEFDAYLLGRDQNDQSFVNEHGGAGNLADRTLGARAKGTSGGWQWTGEGAWQFGRKAGQRVRAWGTAATAQYVFDRPLKPMLGAEHTFASGDADPGDNKVQTFDPLFASGHKYQGYQDVNSWRNGHDFVLRAGFEPAPGWTGLLEAHRFLLQHTRGGWFDLAGNLQSRDATGAAGRELGHEVDLTFRGPFRKYVDLYFGYSRFIAGSYVRRTTGRGDRDWGFFQAALSF